MCDRNEIISEETCLTTLIAGLLLYAVLAMASCGGTGKGDTLDALDRECAEALMEWNVARLDSIAPLLAEKSKDVSGRHYAKACYYLGCWRPGIDGFEKEKRMRMLTKAYDAALEAEDDTLLARIHNVMGLWNQESGNPITARYHFEESMRLAEAVGKEDYRIAAESNLSDSYRQMGDTLGFEYDKDIYRYASENGNEPLLLASALHCAAHLARTGADIDIRYISDLDRLEGKYPQYPGLSSIVLAEHHLVLDDPGAALGHVEKALAAMSADTDPDIRMSALLLKGRALSGLSKWRESESVLQSIAGRLDDYGTDYDKEVYFKTSIRNLSGMGEIAEAFSRQSKFVDYQQRRRAMLDADQLNMYRVRYEVDKLTAKERESSERLARMWKWILAGLAVLTTAVASYSIHRVRRNRIHRKIVSQNLEYLKSIGTLREEISRLKSEHTDATPIQVTDPVVQGITDSKVNEIWERIEALMEKDRIWTDPQVTRDMLAEKADTNRTYISKVIQVKTGMSYSQFMNHRRVTEAMKRLADPSDNTTMTIMSEELGFITRGTFHNAFKQVTGMSPSAFRLTVKNMT